MLDNALRRLVIALIAAAVGVAALGTAQPYGGGPTTTPIELRVWQGLDDPTEIGVGARAPDGVWGELGMVPLPLDGLTPSGRYRYGQTTLEVPLRTAAPVGVEVWVWQAARDPHVIYVSARGVGGSWDLLGTFRFRVDHGVRPDLAYRFGDMRIEVELPEQRVITLAGSAMQWGNVDGVGRDARFGGNPVPTFIDLDVDADGSVVVVAYYNQAVRRIAPDGTVTTIAGNNGAGARDGPANVAQFHGPTGVAIAPDGSLYVGETVNRRIRRVTPDGRVTTVAGGGPMGYLDDPPRSRDGPAHEAVFGSIDNIALAPDGDLYIDDGSRIRRLSPSGWVSTFAGGSYGYADGPHRRARFGYVLDMTVDAVGNLYLCEVNPWVPGAVGRVAIIRKVTPDGTVRTLYRDPFPAHRGGFMVNPSGLVVTDNGSIYIANTGRDQLVELMPDGELRAIAGTGEAGSFDGPYGVATFNFPGALALAPSGALIVADQAASTVRAILPGLSGFSANVRLAENERLPLVEGVSVEVFAGRVGGYGYSGDGDAATSALFRGPRGIALDRLGGVLVTDFQNHAIRRISADGTVSTLAGGNGDGGLDGAPEHAQFDGPGLVAVDRDGTVYVVDDSRERVRRIANDGTVSTVEWDGRGSIQAMEQAQDGSVLIAREGDIWSPGSDGTMVFLARPGGHTWGFAAGDDGSFYYVHDRSTNFTLKRLTGTADVSTVFEDGRGVYGGPFGHRSHQLAVAPDGTFYVADWSFRQVVRIAPDGTAAIVVDHETPGLRGFNPRDILVTPQHELLVSDSSRHVIWKITIDEDAGR